MTDLIAKFLASTDQVLLRQKGVVFQLLSPETEWFRKLWPRFVSDRQLDSSDYLAHFLEEANEHWSSGASSPLSSGPFIEQLNGVDFPLEAKALNIDGERVLQLQSLGMAFDEQQKLLQAARENLLDQEVLEREVSHRTEEIRGRELEIAERLIYAAGFRDEETGAHIRRIGYYSGAMARALGWSPLAIDDIQIAAPMHDIGKIGIPDCILKKPGRLTNAEFLIMKTHTTIGREMLNDSSVPMLKIAADIAGGHHEFWNGSGYPNGLQGDDIPVAARIVSIVDVYDALVHSRVYKEAFQEHVALDMMQALVKTQFDPDLFNLFVENLEEMRDIRHRVLD